MGVLQGNAGAYLSFLHLIPTPWRHDLLAGTEILKSFWVSVPRAETFGTDSVESKCQLSDLDFELLTFADTPACQCIAFPSASCPRHILDHAMSHHQRWATWLRRLSYLCYTFSVNFMMTATLTTGQVYHSCWQYYNIQHNSLSSKQNQLNAIIFTH